MAVKHHPKVLTLASHYLPGFKAGGPIASVANLVANMGDEFDFHIFTRDRDLGDRAAYPGIEPNKWHDVGKSRVLYARPSVGTPLRVARVIRELRPDLVYINSFFDLLHCIAPIVQQQMAASRQPPLVIAPRGQFALSALRFKSARKRLFLHAFKSTAIARRAVWQASSEGERLDVLRVVGARANIVVAPNLSVMRPVPTDRAAKEVGTLKLAFLARVAPVKNLRLALDVLADVKGRVSFDIWGPIEDDAYAGLCRHQIASLPANIVVRWCGSAAPTQVAKLLSQYDATILPTFGENYGHAIVESMSVGCPVVISDRTPWRNLESQQAGWDLPLDPPIGFRNAIESLCQMNETDHRRLREGAMKFVASAARTADNIAAHRRLFELTLDGGGRLQNRRRQRAA